MTWIFHATLNVPKSFTMQEMLDENTRKVQCME